jgi:hypothetical protein
MDIVNDRTTTPSNTGRRRAPLSAHADVTPGHVAQMQRLFQSAKASLRMDMAFAASPNGSIGSRLPPTTEQRLDGGASGVDAEADINRVWRYSTAPGILLGSDRDVREPVPEASPVLPPLRSSDAEPSINAEPISSGFNSPVVDFTQGVKNDADVYGSSPPAKTGTPEDQRLDGPSVSELQGKMTGLNFAEVGLIDAPMEESPTVAHVKRLSAADVPLPASRPMSAEVEDDTFLHTVQALEGDTDEEIFLSEPAKAAAESAKAKRGILRSLFFRHSAKETHQEPRTTPGSPPNTHVTTERVETPELFSRKDCPDPTAHLTPQMLTHPHPHLLDTPDAAIMLAQGSHGSGEAFHMGDNHKFPPPTQPYQRATATGSPMPFTRAKSPPTSPPYPFPPSKAGRTGPRPFSPPFPHKDLQRSDYPQLNSEHFQPGWYYTRGEPAGPSSRLNPMTYSFSTAAAKTFGQSAAPDSRIRDSYRTDTLTPLAKPPSRYRKTGIAAMASTRGVGKYYGGNVAGGNAQATGTGTKRSQRRSGVQFRSSPPLQTAEMVPGINKRRRPKDEDELHVMRDDSQIMELDDDTRAAIRMSLFGTETPEMMHARETLRELSPNVSTTRKDRRQRKKRRPSYWDGDLKEVQHSPAARNNEGKVDMSAIRGSVREGAERIVLTSPPKDGVESLKSQHLEIEGKENISVRNSSQEASLSYDAGDEDIAMAEDGEGTMMAIELEVD